MLPGWLFSVLNLLNFFRCTAIWLDVVLMALGIFGGWVVVGLTVVCLSAVVAIFNITVCVLDRKTKKRTQALPAMKMSVICLDFFFALCYLALFVLELLQGISITLEDYGYQYGLSLFGAHVYIGCLVACHYHFFFASVSLHGWRLQRKGKLGQENKELEMCPSYEVESQSQAATAYVAPKA